MDEADAAQRTIEIQLEAAIRTATASVQGARRTGRCLNCDERFPQGDQRVYCDADCGEDHEKRTRRQ